MTTARRASVVLVTGLLVAALSAEAAGARGASATASYADACRSAGTLVAATVGGPTAVPIAARTALPPTPLPTVLGAAKTAVVARVTAVLYQGPKPSPPRHPPLAGPIPPSRCQVVRLAVTQVLKGAPPGVLVVVKPRAPYSLTRSRRPHVGTFLLDSGTPFPTILGNYGPDPYAPADVSAALGDVSAHSTRSAA